MTDAWTIDISKLVAEQVETKLRELLAVPGTEREAYLLKRLDRCTADLNAQTTELTILRGEHQALRERYDALRERIEELWENT